MKRKIFLCVLCLLSIGLITFGYIHFQHKVQKQVVADNKTDINENRYSEKEKNFYEKLRDGETVRYLVIGDSVGAGAGGDEENWKGRLNNLIRKKYGSPAFSSNLVKGGSDTFDGLIEFDKSNTFAPYDAIFIVFGQNDLSAVTSKQYGEVYESLLKRVNKAYPSAEIFPIIESGIKNDEYPSVLNKLAKHYGLTPIDTRLAFEKSGKGDKELYSDEIHPNNDGYMLYAKQIVEQINVNEKNNKKTGIDNVKQLYDGSSNYDVIKKIEKPSDSKGFRKVSYFYESDRPKDTLEFEFKGDTLGVSVLTNIDGGYVDMYVDNKLTLQRRVYFPVELERHWLVASDLGSGKHRVKFVVNNKQSEESEGKFVRIKNIIVNE